MFKWIKNKWAAFECWLDCLLPKVKVKLVTLGGMIYSAAVALQGYFQGLPLDKIVNPTTLLISNVVLFTLIFWLRNIGERVAEREEA